MSDGERPGSVEVAERRRGGLTWLWVLLGVLLLGLVAWLLFAGDDEESDALGAGEQAVVEEPVDPAAAADATEAPDGAASEPADPATGSGGEAAASASGGAASAAGGGDASAAGEGDASGPADDAQAAAGSGGGGGSGGSGSTGPVDVTEVPALVDRLPVAQLVDRTVQAQSVLVQEVVADEAFYVGPSAERAVLVRLPQFAGAGAAAESPFDVAQGDRVSFTGTLAEVTDGFLAQLRRYDPSETLEPGEVYVQARELEITS